MNKPRDPSPSINIVQLHAGERVTLEPSQQTSESMEDKFSAPHCVLVVDDSKDARNSLATLLGELGYLVQVAENGKVALELALDFLPQAVLLDVVMPDMSGFKLAEQFRAHALLRDATLITLTGWEYDMDAWLSKHAGCDYHLQKPVDISELETLLSAGRPRPKFGKA